MRTLEASDGGDLSHPRRVCLSGLTFLSRLSASCFSPSLFSPRAFIQEYTAKYLLSAGDPGFGVVCKWTVGEKGVGTYMRAFVTGLFGGTNDGRAEE